MNKFANIVVSLTIAALVAVIACENSVSPTGPSPPPVYEPVPEPEPEPVGRKRLNTPFSWHMTRGFSLFSGPQAEESDIVGIFDTFRSSWYGLTVTARVCAELQSWPGDRPWLQPGPTAFPYDDTSPAYAQLKRFLDTAVTVPQSQVLVVAVCNLKEDGTSFENMNRWVHTVCKLTSSYPNTAVEVVNEAKHPRSSLGSRSSVNQLMRTCHDASSRQMEIGSDSNINERNRSYEYSRSVATFLSYHPWRNPDPTKEDFRGIVRDCIGCTVFSETTCYDDTFGLGEKKGLCTNDPLQIEDYARGVEKSGGVFFYHTVWGLGWPNVPVGYVMPKGNWEVRHGR